jgi:Notch-like protein
VGDACADNFCQNGACVANEGSADYACSCYDGYEGQFCERKRNNCLNANCNNGKCVDTFDGFECLCPLGTTTNNFDCSPINYCSDLATKCVFDNTHSCVNTPAGNRCNCKRGYGGDKCELLLDVCEITDDACHNNGVCVPLDNGDHNKQRCIIC